MRKRLGAEIALGRRVGMMKLGEFVVYEMIDGFLTTTQITSNMRTGLLPLECLRYSGPLPMPDPEFGIYDDYFPSEWASDRKREVMKAFRKLGFGSFPQMPDERTW